jgi:prenylated cyclic peptide (anacyclamide/piricyclamide family)
MTKKNLKPQQAAPVQREINTTSSVGGTGLTPLDTPCVCGTNNEMITPMAFGWAMANPFAGDDAE